MAQVKRVGILGGGQLGRMLVEAAQRDPFIQTLTLDARGCPASQITSDGHVVGSFKDAADIRALADRVDVLTVEIEHVDTHVLEEVADRVEVQPHWRTVRTIQDKFLQKQLLASRGPEAEAALPPFAAVDGADVRAVQAAAALLGGFPIMLKARTGAYDGRGNYVVRSEADAEGGLAHLRGRPLYAEKLVDFRMELAVMVVKTHKEASRDWETSTLAYPAVETVHKDSICQLTYCPPRQATPDETAEACAVARQAVAAFEGRGIFGVEMFLLRDGKILINEIAPRPHNSGHWTLGAARSSQFTSHLKAVTGAPVHQDDLRPTAPSIMLNVLGGAQPDSHLVLYGAARNVPGADSYDYGKGAGTPGRKMGHIVVTAPSLDAAERRLAPLLELAEGIRAGANAAKAQPAKAQPASKPPGPLLALGGNHSGIAVTMGSDSDLPVLRPGLEWLEQMGLEPFVTITSAHRTPDAMAAFGKQLAGAGFKVAIAAAGGAAHLPGMLAAHTRLPVIGVPVKPSIGDGMDSLLSISNMPRGCPVACVGVNNSVNAAQLAARVLAASDPAVAARLEAALVEQTSGVEAKARRLESAGWRGYKLAK